MDYIISFLRCQFCLPCNFRRSMSIFSRIVICLGELLKNIYCIDSLSPSHFESDKQIACPCKLEAPRGAISDSCLDGPQVSRLASWTTSAFPLAMFSRQSCSQIFLMHKSDGVTPLLYFLQWQSMVYPIFSTAIKKLYNLLTPTLSLSASSLTTLFISYAMWYP